VSEWFENEAFWKELYQFLFPERAFQSAFEQVDNLLKLVNHEVKDVLDLACGPGRHSLVLASRGMNVTAVDRSSYLLENARRRAEESGVSVEWVQKDMRHFRRSGSFDLAINMFTSFGYFEDKNEDVEVLKNILSSLKKGGFCVIDVCGKEWLAKNFQSTLSHENHDGSILIERHDIYDDWTRISNEWILLKGNEAKRFRFCHTIYSGQELKDRMLIAGFSDVKLYGGLDGCPYDRNANRLVAVAVK